MWVLRHALAIAVVAAACAIAAGVLVFARPVYRPDVQVTSYDMRGRTHFTVQRVRAVFAAHGLRLRRGDLLRLGRPGAWMLPLEHPSGLEVEVLGPRSHVGWGRQRHEALSALVGNVGVSYYGDDAGVIGRAKAALSDLKG